MVDGSGSLEGRVALVTGASSGIGAGCAAELAARGAEVLLTGRDAGRLDAAVQAAGERCEGLAADLVDDAAPERVAARCVERFGRIDVLVHSAGIYVNQPFEEATMRRPPWRPSTASSPSTSARPTR
jgi:NAD(P)-dependent dehydrogenase (short-subunit alcohol dehydrogenase family)